MRNRFDLAAEHGFDWVINEYDRGLTWVLDHQVVTLIVAMLTLVMTSAQYIEIPKGFFPVQDTGAIQGSPPLRKTYPFQRWRDSSGLWWT